MPTFKKYTTTVVGAHSVPRWYEELEKLVESGKLGKADMADAQFRASQAALLDMEAAGIDILTAARCIGARTIATPRPMRC
jgi:5-methyltetrahydropteroyltriglutamate--homocysteine methyltransferase